MAKIRGKVSQAAAGNSTAKSDDLRKKRKKKKRLFWKKAAKLVQEKMQQDSPKAGCFFPPKTPQEVSSNWKALKELLTQKAASSDSALCVPNTYSKKKHAAKNGGAIPPVSKVNGTGQTLKFKPAEKARKAQAEACNSGPVAKPERPAPGKTLRQAQKDKEKPKGSQGKGHIERKKGDIKHKRRKTDEQPEPALADIWFDDVDPDDIEAALGPEAAEVARKQLDATNSKPRQLAEQALVKEKAFEGLTKAVAMDCEMVGVGPSGEDNILARVSIVNLFGKCVYDKYVKPTETVTDYRTAISGIRPQDLKTGEDFKVVQKDVADILRGRILVGHALHNDLKILFLDHPKKKIRDTQRYKPFKQAVQSGRPSLKLLCEKLLNVTVQTSAHSSIQDAQAAMRLYTMAKKQWEASLKEIRKGKKE
ncbi:RNA exonuclease 4 [Tiliqua scincoides]|uniref:RNA exonuclease 4 n=1 Tax=Tiliqua scincoides TaxID=71010 RepID=UPI00346194C4